MRILNGRRPGSFSEIGCPRCAASRTNPALTSSTAAVRALLTVAGDELRKDGGNEAGPGLRAGPAGKANPQEASAALRHRHRQGSKPDGRDSVEARGVAREPGGSMPRRPETLITQPEAQARVIALICCAVNIAICPNIRYDAYIYWTVKEGFAPR